MDGRIPFTIHEKDDLEKIALDENTHPLVRRAINRMAYLEMENEQLRAAYGLFGAILKDSKYKITDDCNHKDAEGNWTVRIIDGQYEQCTQCGLIGK